MILITLKIIDFCESFGVQLDMSVIEKNLNH